VIHEYKTNSEGLKILRQLAKNGDIGVDLVLHTTSETPELDDTSATRLLDRLVKHETLRHLPVVGK